MFNTHYNEMLRFLKQKQGYCFTHYRSRFTLKTTQIGQKRKRRLRNIHKL